MKAWLKRHLAKRNNPRCSRAGCLQPMYITLVMTKGDYRENFRLCQHHTNGMLAASVKKDDPSARKLERAIKFAIETQTKVATP